MARELALITGSLLGALALLTITSPLHAADNPTTPVGYKQVPLKSGGYVLTPATPNAHKTAFGSPSSDKYDPSSYDLSHTASMANKSFLSDSIALSKNSSTGNLQGQSYLTKPFAGQAWKSPSAPDLHKSFSASSASSSNSNNPDFTRSYSTARSDMAKNRPFDTSTSNDQDRTAALTSQKTSLFATTSPDAQKQYLGPGAQKVPTELQGENKTVWHLAGLPSRALTVDEVRNLINHGFTPDTANKPEPASKPLNDPDYKPEPLREAPAPASDDDGKNDAVPAPGTMAQPPPENSESLPQP